MERESQHAATWLVLKGELMGSLFEEFLEGERGRLVASQNVPGLTSLLRLVLIQGR